MASINIEPKVGSRKHTLSFLVFIELRCFFRGLLGSWGGGGGGGGNPSLVLFCISLAMFLELDQVVLGINNASIE